jgi:hypothetical protein
LEKYGKYFQELFDLTFLDYLELIRGTKKSELLDDLPKIEEIINNERENLDEDELTYFKYVINHYETIIEKKKKRNKKKSTDVKNLFACKLVRFFILFFSDKLYLC